MPDLPAPRLSPEELAHVVEQALTTPPPRSFVGRAADAFRYLFTGKGFFPPGEPLRTVAPEGTPPRQMAYPISANRLVTPRATEAISFQDLRNFSTNATAFRACIETVKDLHERFGAEVVAKDEDHATADTEAHIRTVQDFVRSPDGHHTLSRWFRMLLEDVLVIDAPTVLVRRNATGTEPWAWELVDGATVKPLIDVTGRRPLVGPAYEQIVYGIKTGEFTQREMLYIPRNPRPHKIYGHSPVEQGLLIAGIAFSRETSQLAYFTDGNVPDVFYKAPKDWTPDQLMQAKLWFDQMRGDIQGRRGVMVVPEAGVQEYRQPPLKDDFDEWIWRVATYLFGVTAFHFTRQGSNRATAQVLQDASINEGLIPRQFFLTELFERLVEMSWGFTDVSLKWQEARDPDPEVQSKIEASDVAHAIRTVNEVREEKGLDPVEGGDEPFLIAGQTVILLKDIQAGKYTPLDPTEQARIAEEAKAKIGGGGGAAPPGAGGDRQPDKERSARRADTPPETPAEDAAAAPLRKRARRTVQTIPKRQRNFWLAERETVPPRARPDADWRGT